MSNLRLRFLQMICRVPLIQHHVVYMTVFLGGLFMIPHDVHTEHTESIFQFHFPVQFAILCSCDFGAVHQDGHFVLSHQQQLSFLLVGL